MKFITVIDGQACWVNVVAYSPERPMVITGSGFGDAEAPEPEEFDYDIERPEGVKAPHLQDLLTEADHWRLLWEFKRHKAQLNA